MSITGFATKLSEGSQSIITSLSEQLTHLHPSEVIIFDIAVILILSAVFALIAKLLRQPLAPAYVITGLIIGPLVFGYIKNTDLILALSEVGIAFLLFSAGIEISFRKIKEANIKKTALIGILQVLLIFALTFATKGLFDLTNLQAAYIGVILALSSTMVDVKLLVDKGEILTLHGRLVLGILVVQDIIAIVAMAIFTIGAFALVPILVALGKILGIIVFAALLQKFVLNRLFKFAASNSELLFLSSLAVLFLFIVLSYFVGLSIVIGAFIAGVSLANSPFKTDLESRVSSLRDFFAILFFVALGMQLVLKGIDQRLGLLAALIIASLIIKPAIIFLLTRLMGYTTKTSFLTSASLAQLSEFSLKIGVLGLALNVLDDSIFSTVILATIITMSLTPYLIKYKEGMFNKLGFAFKLFERLPVKEKLKYSHKGEKEILLIGAHRMGAVLLKDLMKQKDKLLVMDNNPDIIKILMKNDISCLYGDVVSPDLLEKINTKKLRLVISTIPTYEENLHLLKRMKAKDKNIKVIVNGARISETEKLYKHGADYVINTKITAGEEIAEIVRSKKPDLKKAKRIHLKRLADIHKLLY